MASETKDEKKLLSRVGELLPREEFYNALIALVNLADRGVSDVVDVNVDVEVGEEVDEPAVKPYILIPKHEDQSWCKIPTSDYLDKYSRKDINQVCHITLISPNESDSSGFDDCGDCGDRGPIAELSLCGYSDGSTGIDIDYYPKFLTGELKNYILKHHNNYKEFLEKQKTEGQKVDEEKSEEKSEEDEEENGEENDKVKKTEEKLYFYTKHRLEKCELWSLVKKHYDIDPAIVQQFDKILLIF